MTVPSDWALADDPDYMNNGSMARFFYWVCDRAFEVAEWFAWERFE